MIRVRTGNKENNNCEGIDRAEERNTLERKEEKGREMEKEKNMKIEGGYRETEE